MHALIVVTHPAGTSLTRSVATEIAEALEAKGHSTEISDLVREGFDPVFGPADHAAFAGGGPTPSDVVDQQQRIDRADQLVIVYPVYWWSMPALLKGWIDRVFISGWAFEEDAKRGIIKKLGRLKVHLVAMAGAAGHTYTKRGYRQAMQTQIEEGIFDFCGAPVATSQLISTDTDDPASAVSRATTSLLGAL